VAWRVDQIDQIVTIKEGNRTGLHRDTSILLVESVVHHPQLTRLTPMDNPVGGDQTICQRGLSMVDMGYDGDVPETGGVSKGGFDLPVASLLSYH
jgi:hypothetical protein